VTSLHLTIEWTLLNQYRALSLDCQVEMEIALFSCSENSSCYPRRSPQPGRACCRLIARVAPSAGRRFGSYKLRKERTRDINVKDVFDTLLKNVRHLKGWTVCGIALVSFAAGSLITARLAT
jgi:hypothetical protein